MPQLSEFELDIKTKLLRATFLSNLAFFQQYMPELYQFYKNYQTKDVKLTFDHNGEVNLVSKGKLIYAEHPERSSQQQVDAYFEEPRQFVNVLNLKNKKFNFEHEKQLHSIYERREDILGESKPVNVLKNENSIDFMAMIGVGLGYQCEALINKLKIRYFYIWEPDPDIFHCAMHTINFKLLYDSSLSLGGRVIMKVGGNESHFVNEIDSQLKEIGHFNIARLFMYRHYRSEENDKAFNLLAKLCYRLSTGWGFFEDEVISVAHTLSNISQGYPILLDKSLFDNQLKDKPVFIVGNGPSLDVDIEYLKKNQHNAIIFSCGTALCSLLHSGITPDFHVEIERTKMVYDWILPIGMEDKLKEINIISLNTVHTDALKLFKNAYLLPKPKDGGMDFFYQFIEAGQFTPVMCSNPTVTNGATAAAAYMGFSKFYLFGVDYGYKSEKAHHAKGSLYFKEDFKGYTEKMPGDFKVKGNFGDEVYTTQIFDSSKGVLEILLESNSDITCYNCSDGALVELSIALKSEDIGELTTITNKGAMIETLLNDAFSYKELGSKNYNEIFINQIPRLKVIIERAIKITSTKVKDRKHLAQLFSEQYKYVKSFEGRRDTELYYRFLRGTLNYFQTNIMTNAYFYRDKQEQIEYIEFALNILHEHLLWLYDHMIRNFDKLSDL